jgi:hypothetical protein
MAVGLALVLGFFTRVAAAAAGVLTLAHPLLESCWMVVSGQAPPESIWFGRAGIPVMLPGLDYAQLLTTAAVLWLSPVVSNPWSLDGLMFGPRQGSADLREPTAVRGEEASPPEKSPGAAEV